MKMILRKNGKNMQEIKKYKEDMKKYEENARKRNNKGLYVPL